MFVARDAAGTLVRTSRAGRNQVPFSGRVGRRALAAGRYVATIAARDASARGAERGWTRRDGADHTIFSSWSPRGNDSRERGTKIRRPFVVPTRRCP